MKRVVGVSEMVISGDAEDTLVTYSLGSCVGVVLHDSNLGIGGLLHAMMPSSREDLERSKTEPARFADAGTLALLQGMFDLGARRKHMVATLVGAATQLDTSGFFRIGERNRVAVRRVLWKNGILVADEDVGGPIPRSVFLDVGTGRVVVKSAGKTREFSK